MEPTENKGPEDPTPASVPASSPTPPAPPATNLSKDERLWAALAHLGGIVFSFIAPLIVWFVKREESAFIDDQAKEAANFQLSVAIIEVACVVLLFIPLIGCVTWLVAIVVWIASTVLSIMAAVKANEGGFYRYPFTLHLIK